MSRCLDPQTPPEKAFRGSKHLLTRYLGDFGRLGNIIPSPPDWEDVSNHDKHISHVRSSSAYLVVKWRTAENERLESQKMEGLEKVAAFKYGHFWYLS